MVRKPQQRHRPQQRPQPNLNKGVNNIMSVENQEKINPQITDVKIGVRTLRKLKIYPLAMADEFGFTDIINEGISEFFQSGDVSDRALVAFVIQFIKTNLKKLLGFLCDREDLGLNVLEELTNTQAAEIAEIIYQVNFVEALKKAPSLAEKMGELLSASARPSPLSALGMEDTDLSISPDSDSEMEESPEPS